MGLAQHRHVTLDRERFITSNREADCIRNYDVGLREFRLRIEGAMISRMVLGQNRVQAPPIMAHYSRADRV